MVAVGVVQNFFVPVRGFVHIPGCLPGCSNGAPVRAITNCPVASMTIFFGEECPLRNGTGIRRCLIAAPESETRFSTSVGGDGDREKSRSIEIKRYPSIVRIILRGKFESSLFTKYCHSSWRSFPSSRNTADDLLSSGKYPRSPIVVPREITPDAAISRSRETTDKSPSALICAK